ncbi:MAG: sporulation transcriptional regulator SpoIIID [Clostridia bacterium]|nr:sporulation transcriptional regulator SpoIIID [Clostridia bacterium]
MKYSDKSRAVALGEYISKTGATVRATSKVFNVSKSTVHKDVTERLLKDDPILYKAVNKVLQKNKQERHLRGGMATKLKYKIKGEKYEGFDDKRKSSRQGKHFYGA